MELVEAEKSCSTGEAHLSVLRHIAEKLSSDALAQDGWEKVELKKGEIYKETLYWVRRSFLWAFIGRYIYI